MESAKVPDNDDIVAPILRNHARLKSERAPWEPLWQEIEDRIDPQGKGGFSPQSPSARVGADNFDVTGVEALDRYTAAMAGITIPDKTLYQGLRFADKELDKIPAIRRWPPRSRSTVWTGPRTSYPSALSPVSRRS